MKLIREILSLVSLASPQKLHCALIPTPCLVSVLLLAKKDSIVNICYSVTIRVRLLFSPEVSPSLCVNTALVIGWVLFCESGWGKEERSESIKRKEGEVVLGPAGLICVKLRMGNFGPRFQSHPRGGPFARRSDQQCPLSIHSFLLCLLFLSSSSSTCISSSHTCPDVVGV